MYIRYRCVIFPASLSVLPQIIAVHIGVAIDFSPLPIHLVCNLSIMRPDIFSYALDKWKHEKPNCAEGLRKFANDLKNALGSTCNLVLYDVTFDLPPDYRIEVITENICLGRELPVLGLYPDQEFLSRNIYPYLLEVKHSKKFRVDAIRGRVLDNYIVYDRLLLPTCSTGAAERILSLTCMRLLLPTVADLKRLTQRQQDILFLVSQGQSSKECAVELGLSPRTVEHQLLAIRSKLGAKNVAHAVSIFVSHHGSSTPLGIST